MKYIIIPTALVAVICSVNSGYGQVSPAAPSTAVVAASPRPDVYHVFFGHAAPGKASALEDWGKKAGANSPMPGHVLFLRHEAGSPWDYVAIQHAGTKATVEPAGNPQGAA